MQDDTSFLSDKQISSRYNVGRATVWRWVQKGTFPKPVKLSAGCSRWPLSDIEAWEAAQADAA